MTWPYLAGPLGLADGREGSVYPLTFGRARLVVGRPGSLVYDDAW